MILIGAVFAAPLTWAQTDPTQIAKRQQALTDAAANRWETAEPLLSALVKGEPADVQACVQLSRRKLTQNKAKEAVELLERAIHAAPNEGDLHLRLGNALAQRIGQVNFMQQAMIAPKMRGAFERAVELDPNHVGGWIGLTQYFANAPSIGGGSLEKAEDFAKEVEKRDAYQGALQRGYVEMKKGQVDAAAQQYRRAGELNPREPWPFVSLGQAYAQVGRKEDARVAFEMALQRQPDCQSALAGIKELDAPAPTS